MNFKFNSDSVLAIAFFIVWSVLGIYCAIVDADVGEMLSVGAVLTHVLFYGATMFGLVAGGFLLVAQSEEISDWLNKALGLNHD